MSVDQILAERGNTHGDYELQAFYAQTLKMPVQQHRANQMQQQQQAGMLSPNAMTYAQYESLEMIAHKMGRILAGDPHHKDHWDDIAGYATLISRQIEKRENEEAARVAERAQPGAPQVEEIKPNPEHALGDTPRFLATEAPQKEAVQ